MPARTGRFRRTRSQAIGIARNMPASSVTIAIDSRHEALNGDRLAFGPPPPRPWSVSTPQATVAVRAIVVARNVRRQIGATAGRRRFANNDCSNRNAQMLPTPTSASRAITTCAGRTNAKALPTKQATDQVGLRVPSSRRLYKPKGIATAANPN